MLRVVHNAIDTRLEVHSCWEMCERAALRAVRAAQPNRKCAALAVGTVPKRTPRGRTW